jgi:branched-chain amino acid transport system ATP-binding protein
MASLGMGYVPEGRQVFGELSVYDNLILGGYSRYELSWKPTLTNLRHILGRNNIEQDMANIHTLFPILDERKTQKAGSLSGGEQQMLAIGRAMMCKPKLMLLDEPTIGLSPVKAKEILRLVLRLRQMGLTILLVEQNAGAAMKIADRVYVLENGRVMMEGVPQDLLADSRVQQAYLGKSVAASPTAN